MNSTGNIYDSLGWNGAFSIFITLGFIAVVWVLLQEVKWEEFFRNPRSPKARLTQLIVAVIIGHLLASFALDYWNWTSSLKWFFVSS